jgi:hypothetical protein
MKEKNIGSRINNLKTENNNKDKKTQRLKSCGSKKPRKQSKSNN